jgi:hypothetical protein
VRAAQIVRFPGGKAFFSPGSITIAYDRSKKHVVLALRIEDLESARMFRGNKLVLEGKMDGDAWQVAVVDVSAGVVSDSFFCYSPAISPDGRFIAYVKFFPEHGIDSAEHHYLLYDAALSRAANRPTSGKLDIACVGRAFYPPEVGNSAGDNVNIVGKALHVMASDNFFWNASSSEFVFADQLATTLSAVFVSLKTAQPTVEIASMPAFPACREIQGDCHERLSAVQFGDKTENRYQLTFRGVLGTPSQRYLVPVSYSTDGELVASSVVLAQPN